MLRSLHLYGHFGLLLSMALACSDTRLHPDGPCACPAVGATVGTFLPNQSPCIASCARECALLQNALF